MTLRESFEHEHCAYLGARTPVCFASEFVEAEAAQSNVLSVFRKRPSL